MRRWDVWGKNRKEERKKAIISSVMFSLRACLSDGASALCREPAWGQWEPPAPRTRPSSCWCYFPSVAKESGFRLEQAAYLCRNGKFSASVRAPPSRRPFGVCQTSNSIQCGHVQEVLNATFLLCSQSAGKPNVRVFFLIDSVEQSCFLQSHVFKNCCR